LSVWESNFGRSGIVLASLLLGLIDLAVNFARAQQLIVAADGVNVAVIEHDDSAS